MCMSTYGDADDDDDALEFGTHDDTAKALPSLGLSNGI